MCVCVCECRWWSVLAMRRPTVYYNVTWQTLISLTTTQTCELVFVSWSFTLLTRFTQSSLTYHQPSHTLSIIIIIIITVTSRTQPPNSVEILGGCHVRTIKHKSWVVRCDVIPNPRWRTAAILRNRKYAIIRPRIVRRDYIYITWRRAGLSASAELVTRPTHASAVFAVERCLSVCLSVRHTPVLCLNDWTCLKTV